MKHSSRQFGDKFSGFGCQNENFSRIGACVFVFFVLFVSVRLFVPFFFFFKENDIHKGLYRNTVSFELMQLAISNKQ